MADKAFGIIYLDRNGFVLFASSLPTLIQFVFDQNLVRDLEVIEKEKLTEQIKAFVLSNNLVQTDFVILLSDNLLFKKPFVPDDPKEQEQITTFLDNIPFEHPSSVIFKNKESEIIATNKELYQILKNAFEGEQAKIFSIVPAFICEFDPSMLGTLTVDQAREFYKKANSLMQFSFLTEQDKQSMLLPKTPKLPSKDQDVPTSQAKKPATNIRLYILIGVFAVLIATLVILFLFNPFA